MDTQNPLDIVRTFSREIQNGRTLADAARHTGSELFELHDEIALVASGQPEGQDGVVGEAIDIIACARDVIFLHDPQITDEKINAILLAKCEKWARRYRDSVDGDRTID